jgi:delta-aminolevulinic acid dehydratase/porphobilinogen synthase
MEVGAADATGNPVVQALDQLTVGLDHLVKLVEDGGLDHYDDPGLVGFLQDFEKVRNRLSLVDHVSIAAVEVRSEASRVPCRSFLSRKG